MSDEDDWVGGVNDSWRERRAQADAGLIGTDGPRDPADDWPGEQAMTPAEIEAAYRRRLGTWDES